MRKTLLQEAYLRAFHFSEFNGNDAKAWLLTIVRNTCLTWLRPSEQVEAGYFDEQTIVPEREKLIPKLWF